MPSKRESSVRVDYVPALCTHRPSLLSIERFSEGLGLVSVWRESAGTVGREDARTRSLGESKSRNKVSVGEPAEGSFPYLPSHRAQGRRLFRELRPRLSRPCPVRPGARRTSRTPFEGRRVEIPCTPGRLHSGLLRVDGLFSLSVYLSLSPSFESV